MAEVLYTLHRQDGSIRIFSENDLEAELAHLRAADQKGCASGDDIYFLAATQYLLVMDIRNNVNRRFSELFDALVDPTSQFHLRFQYNFAYYNFQEAMQMAGAPGPIPTDPIHLDQVYMFLYSSQAIGGQYAAPVGTGHSLVYTGGGGITPAQIRSINSLDANIRVLNSLDDESLLIATNPQPTYDQITATSISSTLFYTTGDAIPGQVNPPMPSGRQFNTLQNRVDIMPFITFPANTPGLDLVRFAGLGPGRPGVLRNLIAGNNITITPTNPEAVVQTDGSTRTFYNALRLDAQGAITSIANAPVSIATATSGRLVTFAGDQTNPAQIARLVTLPGSGIILQEMDTEGDGRISAVRLRLDPTYAGVTDGSTANGITMIGNSGIRGLRAGTNVTLTVDQVGTRQDIVINATSSSPSVLTGSPTAQQNLFVNGQIYSAGDVSNPIPTAADMTTIRSNIQQLQVAQKSQSVGNGQALYTSAGSAISPTIFRSLSAGPGVAVAVTPNGNELVVSGALVNSGTTGSANLVNLAQSGLRGLKGDHGVILQQESTDVTVDLDRTITTNTVQSRDGTANVTVGGDMCAITALNTNISKDCTVTGVLRVTQTIFCPFINASFTLTANTLAVTDRAIVTGQIYSNGDINNPIPTYQSFKALQDQVATLQTQAASSQPLSYATNDVDARFRGIPRYTFYRNSPTTYQMRTLADYQWNMKFTSHRLRAIVPANTLALWSLEFWLRADRNRQCAFIGLIPLINGTRDMANSIFIGETGGGNIIVEDFNETRYVDTGAQPEQGVWYYYMLQYFNNSFQLLMKRNNGSTAFYRNSITLPSQFSLASCSQVELYVGGMPGQYDMNGAIGSIRYCSNSGVELIDHTAYSIPPIAPFSTAWQDYPLDLLPFTNTTLCIQGLGSTTGTITNLGTQTTTFQTEAGFTLPTLEASPAIGTYIPAG